MSGWFPRGVLKNIYSTPQDPQVSSTWNGNDWMQMPQNRPGTSTVPAKISCRPTSSCRSVAFASSPISFSALSSKGYEAVWKKIGHHAIMQGHGKKPHHILNLHVFANIFPSKLIQLSQPRPSRKGSDGATNGRSEDRVDTPKRVSSKTGNARHIKLKY